MMIIISQVLIRTTRCHLPEDDNHHSHSRGNFKSYNITKVTQNIQKTHNQGTSGPKNPNNNCAAITCRPQPRQRIN
jgi:hypothetical protein